MLLLLSTLGIQSCATIKGPTPFFHNYSSEHTAPESAKPILWPEAVLLACNTVAESRVCVVNPENPDLWPEQWVAFSDPAKLQEARINADRAYDLSSVQAERIQFLILESGHLVRMGQLIEQRESLYVQEVEQLQKRMLIDKATFGLLTILAFTL